MAAVKHIELPAVTVPPHLWMRSGRPVEGRALQIAMPAVLVIAALLASESGVVLRAGLVLAGAALFLSLPTIMLGRLERLGREVQAADATTAAQLLQNLPTRPVVRYFAPSAWRTLQEGILQLKVGDGRAAAASFVETARLMHQPEAVMLLSAQAHALVLAGERVEAHSLLQRLAKENLLGSRDQLDLGIVLLIESQKKNKQALAYIEAARKTIGDHPRVLAALALALQKTERTDEASELLEQVQISLQGGEADPVVEDLVKRARKGLQDFIEAQLRRERRSRSRRTTIVVSSDLAASEIVSGEIGAGDQAELDNPTTGFRAAADSASPTVISSKSVDGELTSEERTMLNLPNSPTRRAEDARASAFSIEEDGAGEPEEVVVAASPVKAAEPTPVVEPTPEPAAATSEAATSEAATSGVRKTPDAATSGARKRPPDAATSGVRKTPDAATSGVRKTPDAATSGTRKRPPDAATSGVRKTPDAATSGTRKRPPDAATSGVRKTPDAATSGVRARGTNAPDISTGSRPAVPPRRPEPPARDIQDGSKSPPRLEGSGPIGSSLLDSLFSEPLTPTKTENISLINPAVAVPTVPQNDLSKILPPLPAPLPPEPPSRPAPPAKSATEVDVPVFRRKTAIPAIPGAGDRNSQLGNLPTGGNSGASAPPLSSLPVAGGARQPALPTRSAPSFGAPGSSAPKSTTPMFRAPVPGKTDGDPNDESGRR